MVRLVDQGRSRAAGGGQVFRASAVSRCERGPHRQARFHRCLLTLSEPRVQCREDHLCAADRNCSQHAKMAIWKFSAVGSSYERRARTEVATSTATPSGWRSTVSSGPPTTPGSVFFLGQGFLEVSGQSDEPPGRGPRSGSRFGTSTPSMSVYARQESRCYARRSQSRGGLSRCGSRTRTAYASFSSRFPTTTHCDATNGDPRRCSQGRPFNAVGLRRPGRRAAVRVGRFTAAARRPARMRPSVLRDLWLVGGRHSKEFLRRTGCSTRGSSGPRRRCRPLRR